MNKKILITVIIVLGAIALFFLISNFAVKSPEQNNMPSESNNASIPQNNTSTTTSNTATTTTNTGTSTNTNGTIVTAKLGQTMMMSGVTGILTDILEDSRCPINVQCIQAGTVRVKGHVTYGSINQDVILALNKPFSMNGYSATLIGVKPEKTAGITIVPADYVFTFLIK